MTRRVSHCRRPCGDRRVGYVDDEPGGLWCRWRRRVVGVRGFEDQRDVGGRRAVCVYVCAICAKMSGIRERASHHLIQRWCSARSLLYSSRFTSRSRSLAESSRIAAAKSANGSASPVALWSVGGVELPSRDSAPSRPFSGSPVQTVVQPSASVSVSSLFAPLRIDGSAHGMQEVESSNLFGSKL